MIINYMKKICLVTVLAVVTICGSVSAIEVEFPVEKIDIHGFFSQGYMNSTDNDVYIGSRRGSFNLREYGINFSGYLTDDIFLATQIMAYELGGQGDDKPFLHYGLLDYRMSNEVGIKLGRIRIPAGLYNETRDIDMIRKSVFLPQNIYCEYYRDYYSALDGVSIHGSLDLNNLGYLSYQAGIGKPITSESSTGDYPYNFNAYMEGVKNIKYGKTHSTNFQLLWEAPVDGLRFGYTWRRLDAELYGDVRINHPLAGLIWIEGSLDLTNYVSQVWSAEYVIDRLTLMSEAVVRTSDGLKQNQGWYFGWDYELTDKLGAGMYYSEYVVTDESTDLEKNDQNTISVFSRYNITDNWLIKGQVDFNDGNGNSQFMARKNEVNDGDSVMVSLKTTWSF